MPPALGPCVRSRLDSAKLRRITEPLRIRVEPDKTAKSVPSTHEDPRTVANIREEPANTCEELRSPRSTIAS
ncbi:hypothetical protein BV20DRAFT_1058553 [Pilatotrama ljubarskyi]|nr:hypothetical protein BV20DRAFT_1058553 [Pilatotrama ljubarskyi]